MTLETETGEPSQVAGLVRRNARSAGYAAACLLFFGFGWFAPPTVSDLFSAGDALFNYTLRFGGLIMALVALFSLLGRPILLILYATASMAIGVSLVVSAAMMIFGGHLSLYEILYLVFGGMFVSAGIRSVRDYIAAKRTNFDRPVGLGPARAAGFSPRGPTASGASSLKDALGASDHGDRPGNQSEAAVLERVEPPDRSADLFPDDRFVDAPSPQSHEQTPRDKMAESDHETESAPSGFLASLGKKPPPRPL